MKASKVKISEITTSYQNRIKPNGYLVEGKRTMIRLSEKGAFEGKLGDYVDAVFRPGIFKRIFVSSSKHGLPYITAQAMMNIDPLANAKLLSIKQTRDLEPMILKNHSILVSCAGSVGNIRIIDKEMSGKVGSQDIIRVIPKDKFGFYYAFLNSQTIYSYLQSQIYGSVVPRLEPEIVSSIPVPCFTEDFKDVVDKIIKESCHLREYAIDYFNEAIRILSNHVKANIKNKSFKVSSVKIQEICSSFQQRLDPPALMNEGVEAMKEVISRMPYKYLGQLDFIVRRPGIFKRIYVEKGIPYIKGSDIFLINPFRRCEKLSKNRTPFIDEMLLKEGQILVTCAGSCGNIKMITKEYEEKQAIGSQDIIRIDSKYTDDDYLFNKEYLFTYLQLPFVNSYIQSLKYGSVIERIEPFHVESIPIIEPTIELSKEIKDYVTKYMDAQYKAFTLEEKAISMVEQEIEKWNN